MNLIALKRTVVINVVGLTPALLGADTPRISAFLNSGKMATIDPVTPAVTCSVQSSFVTGAHPDEHGIVGNGWYFRDEAEVRLWRQSNHLVQRPKLWDIARSADPGFTVANLFWWYNMYSGADFSVTPRPMYLADGRKVPDIYTRPTSLRFDLQDKLGQFPLFNFWGPASSIASTEWITSAAIAVDKAHRAGLTLVYLPHLDYALQKLGPNHADIAKELRAVDVEVGRLIDHFHDARVVILSEYGITEVSHPIHLNRLLRERNLVVVRDEMGHEQLDCGASAAFAVADHQIAHIYLNDPRARTQVLEALHATPTIAAVYSGEDRAKIRLNHPRAGDIVAISRPDAWFTYYFWFNDDRAPDYARTVDIHRKPGYDPAELFIDPQIAMPKLKLGLKLLRKKLGFRTLMDVIPLDASLVKGSHGAPPASAEVGPLVISNEPDLVQQPRYHATDIFTLLLTHLQRR